MVNIKLGDKTYENVEAVKLDTPEGGTVEFAPYEETFAAGKADGIEEGKHSEYDSFWDTYQENGNRTDYAYAFRRGWADTNFKPKYNICPTGIYGADCMFYTNPSSLDVSACLAHNGVVLDFSRAESMNATFERNYCFNIPPVDVSSCVSMNRSFYNFKDAKLTINNIREDCTFVLAFSFAYSLTDLTITGIIGQNGFEVASSPLNKTSIISVVNALSSSTTGLTVTLRLDAVNAAFETSDGAKDGSTSEEWLALAASKSNWTISLINKN